MKLANRNIILTGASRGFGRYLACRLWEEGANLLLVARSIYNVYTELPEREGQTNARLAVDLGDYDSGHDIRAQASRMWSHVDGLVSNAAIQGPIGPVWKVDYDEWLETIGTDLMAPVQLCMLLVPDMLKRGKGKIVNLSGGGAANVRPNFSAYAAAKTALVRFSECLAAELVGKGIDVNCVAPGKMSTGMQSEIVKAGPERAGNREYQQACMTTPDTVMQKAADLIVWLLSDESDGTTGRLIAAQWDNWHLPKDELMPETWTLRRVEAAEDPRLP